MSMWQPLPIHATAACCPQPMVHATSKCVCDQPFRGHGSFAYPSPAGLTNASAPPRFCLPAYDAAVAQAAASPQGNRINTEAQLLCSASMNRCAAKIWAHRMANQYTTEAEAEILRKRLLTTCMVRDTGGTHLRRSRGSRPFVCPGAACRLPSAAHIIPNVPAPDHWVLCARCRLADEKCAGLLQEVAGGKYQEKDDSFASCSPENVKGQCVQPVRIASSH